MIYSMLEPAVCCWKTQTEWCCLTFNRRGQFRSGRPAFNDRPIDRSTNWPTNQLMNQPMDRPTNWPTDQLTDRPIDRPTNWPTNWPTNQLTDWPIRTITKFLSPDIAIVHASIKLHFLLSPVISQTKQNTKQNTKQRFLYMNSCPIRRSILFNNVIIRRFFFQ